MGGHLKTAGPVPDYGNEASGSHLLHLKDSVLLQGRYPSQDHLFYRFFRILWILSCFLDYGEFLLLVEFTDLFANIF